MRGSHSRQFLFGRFLRPALAGILPPFVSASLFSPYAIFPFFPFPPYPFIPSLLLPFITISLFPCFPLAVLSYYPITLFPSFLLFLLPYCPLSSSILAGFFIGAKKDTRGPFVEFVKAHNEDQSQYLLLQLRDLHVPPEKWEAFLDAYNAVEPWVSVLSAIEKGLFPSCLPVYESTHLLASLTSSFPHSLRIGYIREGNEQQRRVPECSVLHQPIF